MSSYAADLSSVEACRDLVSAVHADHGRIDGLVNDAAVIARGPITDMEEADFDRVVAVNIRAPYFLSQAVHPHMRDGGGGSIVNIASINSVYGLDNVSIYGLTKGAIRQFTQASAAEWAADGIRVNCIAPGFIKTPINAEALWADEARSAWILDRVLLERPGYPDDLVGALLFLLSDASVFMTGQMIVVDGGFDAGGSWERQGPLRWPPASAGG